MTDLGNDEISLSQKANQATLINTLPFIASLIFAAITFSQAIYNAGLYLIPIMRGQFTFQVNIMLKTFLTAAATSTLVFAILHLLGKNKNLLLREERHVETNKIGIAGLVIGGVLLGAGMNLAGACPGTLPVQVGSGFFPNGLYTILGAMIGAMIFITLKPSIQKIQQYGDFAKGGDSNIKESESDDDAALNYDQEIVEENKHRYTIYQWTGYNHIIVRLAFSALFFSAAIVTEILSPGIGNISPSVKKEILDGLWSPFICGPMIGILQLPLMLFGGKHLGSTPAYITTTKLVFSILPWLPERLRMKKTSLDSTWEFLYVYTTGIVTLIFAAFIWPSFQMSNRFPYDGSVDITIAEQIIGGILIVFGAKLASGCTSGHGISGMGHLRTKSFIAVASMFAGGILINIYYVFILI